MERSWRRVTRPLRRDPDPSGRSSLGNTRHSRPRSGTSPHRLPHDVTTPDSVQTVDLFWSERKALGSHGGVGIPDGPLSHGSSTDASSPGPEGKANMRYARQAARTAASWRWGFLTLAVLGLARTFPAMAQITTNGFFGATGPVYSSVTTTRPTGALYGGPSYYYGGSYDGYYYGHGYVGPSYSYAGSRYYGGTSVGVTPYRVSSMPSTSQSPYGGSTYGMRSAASTPYDAGSTTPARPFGGYATTTRPYIGGYTAMGGSPASYYGAANANVGAYYGRGPSYYGSGYSIYGGMYGGSSAATTSNPIPYRSLPTVGVNIPR